MTTPNNNPYGSEENFGYSGESTNGSGGLPSYGQSTPSDAGYGQGGDQVTSGYQGYQANYQGGFEQAPVKKSGLALAALIIGIITLVAILTGFSIVPGIVGVIVAIIALIVNRKKPKEARRTWMSIVGLILSIIGIVASVFFFSLVAIVMGDPAFQACMEQSSSQEELQACFQSIAG